MNRIFCLLALLSACFPPSPAQENRALVIAVGRYPAGSGWLKIHADNDPEILLPFLRERGYGEIVLLLDKEATRQAVVDGLEGLARRCRPGDHVYVHFSGHGQQMFDDNGDEEDGLDEAIIPYDAPRRYEAGVYEGENHLRDDLLGELLDRIRSSAGPDGEVIVAIDACHSATANRYPSEEYVRGTAYVFAPENYRAGMPDPGRLKPAITDSPALAPMTVFSACQADELNYEYRDPESGKFYGSLTWSLVKTAETIPPGTTVAGFFDGLTGYMSNLRPGRGSRQTPYYETTDPERTFSVGRR